MGSSLFGRVTVTVLAVLLCMAGASTTALAHAVLLRSSPAQNARLASSPRVVQLFFSEPLNHRFSSIQVRDTAGAVVDRRDLRFTPDPTEMDVSLPDLAPGFYSVNWTTVSSTDGHRLQGSFPFTVLNADGSAPAGVIAAPAVNSGEGSAQPVDALLRWLLLLGLIALAGVYVLVVFVVVPATAPLEHAGRAAALRIASRLLGIVAPVAALLVVSANLAALLRQAQQLADLSQLAMLLSGRTGLYWILRTALALLAGALAFWVNRRHERMRRAPLLFLLWSGIAASCGALATISLTSHAAARYGAGWGVPSDLIHLLGVSFWLGSLLLLPALVHASRRLEAGDRVRFLARALRRFSWLASTSIAAIGISGLFNASIEIGSLRNLTDTAYGQALIIKVAATLPLVAFGAFNALVLVPRIERAAPAEGSADPGFLERRLAFTAGAEALCGLAVLGVTAVLVLLVPSGDVAAQRRARVQPSATTSSVYRNTVAAGDLQASLVVTPNRTGENDFRVTLTGPDVDAVSRVQLRFQLSSQQVGASSVDAARTAPGQYTAMAANLNAVGRWQVTINVRRNGRDDVNGNFAVEVPDATGATTISSPALRGIWTFPGHGITENQMLGVVLVFAGLVLLRLRGPLQQMARPLRLANNSFAALAMIAGATLFFATHSHPGSGNVKVQENPVVADQRSIDDGQRLYAMNCQVCHGSGGHGDGPAAAGLFPRPVDLTVHVGLHPDYQLFDWITNGIPGTQMPAWRSQFSDQERWDLVNYLRTFSPD